MSSDTSVPPTNNKYETQKLYLSLLPFSMYENPCKQYSRKVKIKRQPQSQSLNSVSGSTEFIIMPSYLPGNDASITTTPATIQTRSFGEVKARKKMKLTSDSSTLPENEPESPKQSTEDEPVNNIIILYKNITIFLTIFIFL